MLIIGMRRRREFEVCLHDPSDGKILLRLYLDLPRAAKNRVFTLKVGCGDVPRL